MDIFGFEIFGLLGLILLLSSWLTEAFQTIKSQMSKVPVEFAFLYFIASVCLAYHAFLLNDSIFLILNLITGLIGVLNLYYVFFGKKQNSPTNSKGKKK